jgi:hypothetical protein
VVIDKKRSSVSFNCQQNHSIDLSSSPHSLTQGVQQELNPVSSFYLNSFQNLHFAFQNTQPFDYTLLGCGYFASELIKDLIDHQGISTNVILCDFTHHIVNRMLQKLSSSIKRKFSSLEIDKVVRYFPLKLNLKLKIFL